MFSAEQALAGAECGQGTECGGARLAPEAGGRAESKAAARAAACWPPQFWGDAKQYADRSGDGQFVRELAYMLVTLHRHGA